MKNIKEMTNNELKLYSETIKNEFDITKANIENMCDKLDTIQMEYNRIINEINLRKNI